MDVFRPDEIRNVTFMRILMVLSIFLLNLSIRLMNERILLTLKHFSCVVESLDFLSYFLIKRT